MFLSGILRGSHKLVTAVFLKSLSQNFRLCLTLRLQLQSVKALSFSSRCISLCDIYNLSLLAIFSIPRSASSLQKPNKPKQNTTMLHPGLPPTLHGIWISIPWDQCSGAGGIFFYSVPGNLEKMEEQTCSPAGPHSQIFSSIPWDGRMHLLPPHSEAANLERRGMENSTPDLKSFQAEVLPEESQLWHAHHSNHGEWIWPRIVKLPKHPVLSACY